MANIPNGGPINLADIRDAINAAGGNATNDLMSFFSAENVAEGSPRKPIVLAQDFAQDFDSTKPNYSSNFWQDGGKYGWRFDGAKVTGSQSPFLDIYNKYDGQMNGWQRALPTGGASSPYRLGDFLGYISDADPLTRNFHVTARIGSLGSFTDYVNPTEIWINDIVDKPLALFIFNVDTPTEHSPSVELAEIEGVKDCYFGVIIANTYGGVNKRFTASDTIAQGYTSVAMNITDLGVGSYTVVPFISDRAIGVTDSDTTTMVVYTLPNVAPVNLRILYQEPEEGEIEVSASVWMYRDSGSNELRFGYELRITNTSVIPQTLSGGYIIVGYTGDMDDRPQTIYFNEDILVDKESTTVFSSYRASTFVQYPPVGLTAHVYPSSDLPMIEVEVENRT